MGVRFSRTKRYKTESIVSDEDKLSRLKQLLGNNISSQGQIFTPGERFYTMPLTEMAETMLSFIGLSIGSDRLYIGFDSSLKVPGLYLEHEGIHYIYIKQVHQKNAFECAAILAHELMHYVLIGGMSFRLEGRLDNEQLTDMATVYTGLGLVVLNGFAYEGNNWAITAVAFAAGVIHYGTKSMSFGYYKPRQFAELIGDYVDSYNIDYDTFSGYVLPAAAHYLPDSIKAAVKHSDNKTDLVKRIQAARRKKAIISTAIAVPIIIGIAVLGAQNSGTTSSVSPQVQQQADTLKATANSLKSQYSSCESQLSSLQSTLDQTNSQMDTYNSDGDTTDYNSLVPEQNQEVANVQNQQSQCQSLYSQSNSAVDAYNSYLRQN